ncbi:MAG: hypothetical protein EA397_15550 [Deltaproteobacteria bacterium]|nr:MAG: hypothetical protein EA397_15550 [Deltaproteobacteria bacterium]
MSATPEPPVERGAPSLRPVRARKGGTTGLVLTVLALAVVGALLGLTWAGRVSRSPPTALIAGVTVLPYLYGLTVAVLFGLWSALPDRRLLPLLLGLVVMVGVGLWGPAWPSWSSSTEQAGTPLRVVTWNVRRLWGGPDDGDDPARCVIETLRRTQADVLSLQEVSAKDVELLERELGLVCTQIDYLGTGARAAGGVAGCVRPDVWTFRSGNSARFVPDRKWRYVFLEIERSGQVVNLLAVHLEPYRLAAGGLQHAAEVRANQGDQSAELLRRVTRFRDPTLLSGDFNSTRDASLHVALRGLLRDGFEHGGRGFGPTFFLSDWLPIRIDFTYVTPDFVIRGAEVLPDGCSDHRALLIDLVLPPPRPESG